MDLSPEIEQRSKPTEGGTLIETWLYAAALKPLEERLCALLSMVEQSHWLYCPKSQAAQQHHCDVQFHKWTLKKYGKMIQFTSFITIRVYVTCKIYCWSASGCRHEGQEIFRISDVELFLGSLFHVGLLNRTSRGAVEQTSGRYNAWQYSAGNPAIPKTC